jgi:hypothetical protein
VFEEAALLAEVARGRVLDLVEDDAADLRAEDERVARVPRQNLAQPDLGEPGAVEGRGVEVPDALVPGGFDGGRGLLVGDRAEHVAEGRGAEAEGAGEDVGGVGAGSAGGAGEGAEGAGQEVLDAHGSRLGSRGETVQDSLGHT